MTTKIDLSKESFDGDLSELVILDGGERNSDLIGLASNLSSNRSIVNVTRVGVWYNAILEDCNFLKVFPNLTNLVLKSKALNSVEGIENLKKLSNLHIHLPRDGSVDLQAIQGISLDRFEVENLSKQHVTHVSRLRKATDIRFTSPRLETLAFLKSISVRNIELFNLPSKDIENLGVDSLERLTISRAPKLKQLSCLREMSLNKLELFACKNLDLMCLSSLKKCSSLSLKGIALSDASDFNTLISIDSLREMSAEGGSIKFDAEEVRVSGDSLENVYLSPINRQLLARLKTMFPSIRWMT